MLTVIEPLFSLFITCSQCSLNYESLLKDLKPLTFSLCISGQNNKPIDIKAFIKDAWRNIQLWSSPWSTGNHCENPQECHKNSYWPYKWLSNCKYQVITLQGNVLPSTKALTLFMNLISLAFVLQWPLLNYLMKYT